MALPFKILRHRCLLAVVEGFDPTARTKEALFCIIVVVYCIVSMFVLKGLRYFFVPLGTLLNPHVEIV